MFLVGPYLEIGEFYSVRSRPGPRRSGAGRQKQREDKMKLKKSNRSAAMKSVVPVVNDTATNVTSEIKSAIERTIDLAFEHIAAECARQREL